MRVVKQVRNTNQKVNPDKFQDVQDNEKSDRSELTTPKVESDSDRARVWHQRNTSFQDNHMLGTTAFGGGGITVWGCFSFDCKLDLYVLDGNLTEQKYRDLCVCVMHKNQ
jgi:hypothetical protein